MSVTVVLFLRHGGAKTPCTWCCMSVICTVFVDDFIYIALNVLDVVIHGVVACKRNRAVVAVIVEVQRIITLFNCNRVIKKLTKNYFLHRVF